MPKFRLDLRSQYRPRRGQIDVKKFEKGATCPRVSPADVFSPEPYLLSNCFSGLQIRKVWRTNGPEVETFPPDSEIVDFIGFNAIPLFKNRAFLHQKYVVEGLSIAQISSQIFSAKETVRENLIRFGISLREAHKAHGRPAQPKYGTKVRQGKVVDHLAERRVIEAVRDMRRNKLSLRQIAKFLTKIGVPTKQRGVSWHPQMVKRLLDSGGDQVRDQGLKSVEHAEEGAEQDRS